MYNKSWLWDSPDALYPVYNAGDFVKENISRAQRLSKLFNLKCVFAVWEN